MKNLAGASARDIADHAPSMDQAIRWEAGALGEQRTAMALSKLGPKWTVLHDIGCIAFGTNRNLDHLVVGPGGVFVINTKNYTTPVLSIENHTLLINKKPVDEFISASIREREVVEECLSRAVGHRVQAQPFLLFLNTRRLRRWEMRGVSVLSENELADFVANASASRVLSDAEVGAVASTARDARTWNATLADKSKRICYPP